MIIIVRIYSKTSDNPNFVVIIFSWNHSTMFDIYIHIYSNEKVLHNRNDLDVFMPSDIYVMFSYRYTNRNTHTIKSVRRARLLFDKHHIQSPLFAIMKRQPFCPLSVVTEWWLYVFWQRFKRRLLLQIQILNHVLVIDFFYHAPTSVVSNGQSEPRSFNLTFNTDAVVIGADS